MNSRIEYISDETIRSIRRMIPTTYTDEKYAEAEKHVRGSKTGISIPMLGRLLGIGYNRAERLMWALSDNKVVVCVPSVQGGKWKLVK